MVRKIRTLAVMPKARFEIQRLLLFFGSARFVNSNAKTNGNLVFFLSTNKIFELPIGETYLLFICFVV